MLGLDHDSLDREQAVVALWKYSLGGKKHIDSIMQFPGCINLTVNLLRSESASTCEAAAGLLRSISMVNLFRDSVAESGAIEEITALLSRPSLTPEVCFSFTFVFWLPVIEPYLNAAVAVQVKEQSICVLWNLSVDEKLRKKIANTDILPLLIKNLDDEDMKVKEAAGGVIANLTLSPCNHGVIVESGLIPKLVELFFFFSVHSSAYIKWLFGSKHSIDFCSVASGVSVKSWGRQLKNYEKGSKKCVARTL